MATFTFNVPIYGFDQWVGASTNNTVSYAVGTTFSLNAGAVLTTISVEDDDGNPVGSPDNFFSDGYIDTPADGSTPSTGNNDQVLSAAVTIDGNTYSIGDQVELEFAFATTTGETFWIIRIDGTNVGISGSVLPEPGTSYTVASSADGQETPLDAIPCFVAGTLIETDKGPIRVEDLSVGDMVRTKDKGYQPIRWMGSRVLGSIDLAKNPKLRPICIEAGVLGTETPSADLRVSPQHRVLVRSAIAQRMFETQEVLVAAKSLLPVDGVSIDEAADSVCYVHLLFDAHHVIFSNDALTESLFTGPEAIKAVPEAARQEIFALFPELENQMRVAEPAALIPKGYRQRGLVSRHIKNNRALVN